MRNRTVRLSAAGFSDWIGINAKVAEGTFAVGLAVVLSSDGNLTYSVQHTMDEIYTGSREWSASRTTTTGTITKTNHGLHVSDWVLFETAAPFNAAYAVASITNQNVFTVTVADAGISTVIWGSALIHTARVLPHEDLAGETATADGNYAFPPRAVRLLVSAYTAGYADFTVIQAGN